MSSNSRKRKVLQSTISILLGMMMCLTGASADEDCTYVGWSAEEKPCPDGYTEISLEVLRGRRPQYLKRCCNYADPAKINKEKSDATECEVTKCQSATSVDPCGQLNKKIVNETEIVFEEMFRDVCTIEDGGGSGIVAYCCQKDSFHTSLVGLLGAEPNEFPHQAKLLIGNGNCGGTIYNKRFIVTASHCIVNGDTYELEDASTMTVTLGTNLASLKGDEFVYQVEKAIPHEQYSKLAPHPEIKKGKHARTFNDIALLKLDRDIKYSDKIQPLQIAPKNFDPFKVADKTLIVGWGTTDTLNLAPHLQKTHFVLRSDDTCFGRRQIHGEFNNEMENQLLCVGGIKDGIWSPTAGGGDSGGPAICRGDDGKIVLCGVTSFGGSDEKCSAHNNEEHCWPSVYAEVAHFYDWIVKHAGKQETNKLYQPYLFGEKVPQGKYDHQVHITSTSGKPCGGTLVAPNMVLTSASCILKTDGSGKSHSGLKVHYGVKDIKSGGGKTFGIAGVVGLPGFPKKVAPIDMAAQGNRIRMTDNFHKDDLAIVKLDKKAPISPNNIPALPSFDDNFHRATEVAFLRNTTLGGDLRSREFKLLDLNDCQKRMNRLKMVNLAVKVPTDLLCGIEKYSGGSLCDRELGGGLICNKGGKEVLCGIQVFRMCEWTIPNGFMNMAIYADWVKDAMEALNKA